MNGDSTTSTRSHGLAVANYDRKVLPGPQFLHELIKAPESDTDSAIEFLLTDDTLCRLSYRDFDDLSWTLTRQIRGLLDDARSSIVPLVIPQSPELYLAWRAVLRAGCCVCPISPDVPLERLKFILADIDAQLVLHNNDSRTLIQSISHDVHSLHVSLDALRRSCSDEQTDRYRKQSLCANSPDSLAYVMYTSGSTGQPKGVKMSHRSVTQSILAHEEHIPTFKRFLQFASPTFDVSIFEIFFPFFRGATLVSRSREKMLDDLSGTINRLGADAAELTPTVAGTLLKHRPAVPCLQILLTIGEMLSKHVIEEFGGDETKPSMLYAMYGPTEAAIHCTVAPRLSSSASVRSIGKPLTTVTALILRQGAVSNEHQIAAREEEGELAIAGQLADGYLNREEQTAEAFIHLPQFGTVYRTGDKAIYRSDGLLEILGRISAGQVKLRGQRVELGEIEEVALKTKDVQQVVASVIDDSLILSCFVTGAIQSDAVFRTCKSWLPPYMRPGEVVLHHSVLPALSSGKVDRKKIEHELRHRHHTTNGIDRPYESDVEANIGSIMNEHLRIPVSRDDDLWEAGLDSLRAMRIAAQLREVYPDVTVATILRSSTIAELADVVTLGVDGNVSDNDSGIHDVLFEHSEAWKILMDAYLDGLDDGVPSTIDLLSPCTSIQLGMLAETTSNPRLNFNRIELLINTGISFTRFIAAFRHLAQSALVLRSGFVPTENDQMPFIMVTWQELQFEDLSLAHPLRIVQLSSSLVEITIHHAIYDGWAWDLIMEDLHAILNDEVAPRRSSFLEVSQALRRHLPQAVEDTSLYHWNRLMADRTFAPFPQLVATKPQVSEKRSVELQLAVCTDDLIDASTRLHTTRQTFLQTCWAVLFSAYSDSEDVTFGTVISGRHAAIAGVEDAIGPCLAMLPTRFVLSRVATLRDLLSYVQRQNLESLEFYDTPLREIQKLTGTAPSGRLFDTLVVWQENARVELPTRKLVEVVSSQDSLDYAVVIEVEPEKDHYRLKLTYDVNNMTDHQAELLASQVNELLTLVATHPDTQLSEMSNAFANEALSIVNPEFEPYLDGNDLVKPIKDHAASRSHHPALKFISEFDPVSQRVTIEELSYAELVQQAGNVSYHLADRCEVKPDHLICIVADKSIELYVAILGAVMAGAGYMCIDPQTPSARLASVLEQAKPAAILKGDDIVIGSSPCKQYFIRPLIEESVEASARSADPSRADHLAYVVFTSGTTGVPKGVLMTRNNLASHINHLRSVYPYQPGCDSLLQACSPAFDVSVFEIFWTWIMGMTLVAAQNDVLFRDLEVFIDSLDITHLSMTPSVAALINPDNVPKLKMLVTAGEPMHSKVFHQWVGRGLYQGYGPSETTNICNVRPRVASRDAQNNVGVPFRNTSMFVCKRLKPERRDTDVPLCDDDFQPVPRGAVGEIWVGGDQVGRGYIDPVLTAHSFFMHPKYGWLYRSGDVGRVLADDTFVILGREDDQAKLRGQRIELGEINSALLKLDTVIDAISVVDGEVGTQKLITFVAQRQNNGYHTNQQQVSQLFECVSMQLPGYMVPDVIIPVKEMPLTLQGKIDKKKLLSHFISLKPKEQSRYMREQVEEEVFEPLLGHELAVAAAVAKTLNVPVKDIGPKTSFYSLGLDSLNVIRLARDIRNENLASPDVSVILKTATVRGLANVMSSFAEYVSPQSRNLWKHLQDCAAVREFRQHHKDSNVAIETILSCTGLQLSMLSATGTGGRKSYRNKLKFRVRGSLSRLRASWLGIMQRQPLLRTIFLEHDDPDMPYIQLILQNSGAPLRHDTDDETQFGNPLTRDWVRLSVEREGQDTHVILDIHHALYDAEAMNVLLGEVESAYMDSELDSVVPFEAYFAHAVSLNSSTADDFWQSQLTDVDPSRLGSYLAPAARTRNGAISSATKHTQLRLFELEQQARRKAVTPLAFLQAALSQLLFNYLQTDDICFGNVFSGRNLPIEGVERIVGPCFNTLPLRVRRKRDTTNGELVQSLHEVNIGIMPLQPTSLRELQQKYSPDGRPLFDVLLLLQQSEMQLDESIWELVEESGDMDFPFILELSLHEAKQSLEITLHSTVANRTVLEEMLSAFDDTLTHIVRYPEALSRKTLKMPSFILPQAKQTNGASSRTAKSASTRDLTALESHISEILRQLSRRPLPGGVITSETTIFMLGLDSISAVHLASRLRSGSYHISSSDILEAPTLGEIAALCERNEKKPQQIIGNETKLLDEFSERHLKAGFDRTRRTQPQIDAIRPCTPLQCGILSQYIQSSEKLYYNTLRLKLHNNITPSALKTAWRFVVRKHEMLRTGFMECDDDICDFLMVTYNDISLPLLEVNIIDTRSHTKNVHDRMLEQPWHLAFDTGSRVVELHMLHALYDAQSLDIILADVAHVCLDPSTAGSNFDVVSIDQLLPHFFDSFESEEVAKYWNCDDRAMQPTKFPDLNIHNVPGDEQSVSEHCISESLTNIMEACSQASCTLQVACQAAWARILAAYLNQDRITFGVLLSGRNFGDERDEVVFPCINTLPCTVQVDSDNRALLKSLSKVSSGLLRYQQVPFTSIKRWQGLEGEVFNTLLVLQKFSSRLPEHVPWDLIDEKASAEYAVSIEIVPDESTDKVMLRSTALEEVLPREASKILLKQFELMLYDMLGIEAKNRPIEAVLSPVEAHLPAEIRYLHEFVEETASRQPGSSALEFVSAFDKDIPRKEVWTYRQLNNEGNKIANLLRAHSVKTGDLIATCFDKCPEASFAILGVLKAGCAYVAIDPGAPHDRRQFILRDAGCKILLTTKGIADGLELPPYVECIAVDAQAETRDLPCNNPTLTRALHPTDTCYCLYTSGTTGTPKGCLISHESAVQAMLSFQHIFQGHWTSQSRWLQFASFHFDVSVLEQYWSWSVGICMLSAPRDLILEDLPTFLRRTQITHLDLTPSLARLISPEEVPSLCAGVFIVGGEQLTQDIIDTWGDAGCLYNFYGPSEVTIGCTVHPRVRTGTKPTNIGQLWDNVGARVLKPGTEEAVLCGAVGELCLTGVLVGKGYLNRPELTQEKFASLSDGTRIYRTGDLVRLLHDNSFDFLGRIDDQVKLRGQRLEIGEINHIAKSSEKGVAAVATMVVKHPKQGKEQLVCFFATSQPKRGASTTIITTENATSLSASIRRHCVAKLAPYMVPSSFLMVTNLPLSANNKTDMKALKVLYEKSDGSSIAEQGDSQVKMSNEESKIFEAVAKVLGRRLRVKAGSVHPGSRLFELGLDSISAVGLTRALREEGFEYASIQTVMRSSLVVDLVHTLTSHTKEEADTSRVNRAERYIKAYASKHRSTILQSMKLSDEKVENISPCTPLQEGMISTVVNANSKDTTYFAEFCFDLAENVPLDQLRIAWERVEELTSMLRTRFIPTTDGFAQVVLKANPGSTPIQIGRSEDRFVGWVESCRALGGTRPWAVHLEEHESGHKMKLYAFHGVYDGISLDLLLEQVAKEYNRQTTKGLLSSKFYEVLPHGVLGGSEDSKAFWQRCLQDTAQLDLPLLKAPPERSPAECLRFSVNTRLDALDVLSKRLNVTLPAVFHAAWLLCLQQKYQVNPTIGMVISGRTISHPAAEMVIGPMFNTIPSHVNVIESAKTSDSLIKACHKFNVDALPYHHTPLRQIAKWLRTSSEDIFNNLFVFQRERADVYEHDLWTDLPAMSQAYYPINLEIEQKRDGAFEILLVCRSEYLRQDECDSLGQTFLGLLTQLADGTCVELSDAFVGSELQDPKVEPSPDKQAMEQAPLAPETWTAAMCTIRRELAKLAKVDSELIDLHGPTIFELGLDSIDAMKLATRLKQAGIRVAISAIMRAPSVAGIATAVQSDGTNATNGEESAITIGQDRYRQIVTVQGIDATDVEVILPVTGMQEGLLLDFEKYYNVNALELSPFTDVSRMIKAWETLAEDEPILRTRFVAIEDGGSDESFLQVIVKQPMAQIEHRRDATLQQVVKDMSDTAINKGLQTPTLKVVILEVSNKKKCMVVGMPHAAYDGWSLQLLYQAVLRKYNELSEPSSSDQTMTTRAAAAVKIQQHLEDALSEADATSTKQFWDRTIRTARPTTIRSTEKKSRSSQLKQRVSKVSGDEAQRLSRKHGTTIQTLGLASWSILLANRTHQSAICFGMVLSGRTTPGSEDLIFPTFNTVIFSINLSSTDRARRVVQKAHDAAREVSEYQHFPLKNALKLAREEHGTVELFDTLFTFQKVAQQPISDQERLFEEVLSDDTALDPPYAVNVELEVKEGKLIWTIATQKGVFKMAELDDCLCELDEILQKIVRYPDERLFSEEEYLEDGRENRSKPGTVHETRSPTTARGQENEMTPTEALVKNVLAEISKTDPPSIGRATNLFNLGLDSISTIKVAASLKKRGMRVPISKILEAQTVEKIAAAGDLSEQDSDESVTKSSDNLGRSSPADRSLARRHASLLANYGVQEDEIEAVFPVTAGQQYMLDMWLATNGRRFYPTFWLQVRSNISEETIDSAFQKLMDETPALRTTFAVSEEQDEADNLQIVLNKEEARARRASLPWTYTFRRHNKNGTSLVTLRIHHALYDAVSMDSMTEQLNRLCSGGKAAAQNNDFAPFVQSTKMLNAVAKRRQKEFWMGYLNSEKLLQPSSDAMTGDLGGIRLEHFNPSLMATETLKARLREEGVSMQALFFTVVGQIYCTHLQKSQQQRAEVAKSASTEAKQHDAVVIGIYLSLRNLDVPDLAKLAAPTVNVVPLRVPICSPAGAIETDKDVATGMCDAARQVQRDLTMIGKEKNCGVSLEEIWKWSGKEVRLGCVVNWLADLDGGPGDEVLDEKGSESRDSEKVLWHASQEVVQSFKEEEVEGSMKGGTRLPSVSSPPSPFLTKQREGIQIEDEDMYAAPQAATKQEKPTSEGHYTGKDLPWCMPSIDIEAKLNRADGSLAVGIFGQEGVLGGTAGVEGWFEGIRGLLTEMAGD